MITVNKGTKAGTFIEALDKTYEATLLFGQKTDTGDLTGQVVETSSIIDLDPAYINQVLESFIGPQTQVPPMYSAIKKDGVPLYKLAREGQTIDREPRHIVIYDIKALEITKDSLTFSVRVSKGTYIRTLAEDIASSMGMVGHLTVLKRTHVGSFSLKDAVTIDQVSAKQLIPVEVALNFMEKIVIANPIDKKAVEDGKPFNFQSKNQRVLLVTQTGSVLAVYERSYDGLYRSLRGLF
jgi:tRNA pseudouridine55 synthase